MKIFFFVNELIRLLTKHGFAKVTAMISIAVGKLIPKRNAEFFAITIIMSLQL